MRKLWDHYEPLNLDDLPPSFEETAPEPVRKKERSTLSRMWSWLFRADVSGFGQAELPKAIREEKRPAFHQLENEREQYRADVRQALRQWKEAAAYFENVSDPALVDYAVFDMEAAQKRYVYLLKNGGSR